MNNALVTVEMLANAERTIDSLRRDLVEAQMQIHHLNKTAHEPYRTEIASLKLRLQHSEADCSQWKNRHDAVEREYRQVCVERDSIKQQLKDQAQRSGLIDTQRVADIEKLSGKVAELEATLQIERSKSQQAMMAAASTPTARISPTPSTGALDDEHLQQQQTFGGSVSPSSSLLLRPSSNGTTTNPTQRLFLLQTENDSLKLRNRSLETKVDTLSKTVQQQNTQIREQQDQLRRYSYSSGGGGSHNTANNASSSSGNNNVVSFSNEVADNLRSDLRAAQQDHRRLRSLYEELQRVHQVVNNNMLSLRTRTERLLSDNASLEQQLMQTRHSRDLLKLQVDAVMRGSSIGSSGRDTRALAIAKEFDAAFYAMTLEHTLGVNRMELEQMRLMSSVSLDRALLLEQQLAVAASDRIKLERELKVVRRELAETRGDVAVAAAATSTSTARSSPGKQQQQQTVSSLVNNGNNDEGWIPLPLLTAHEQIHTKLEHELRTTHEKLIRTEMRCEQIQLLSNSRVVGMMDAGRIGLLEASRMVKNEAVDAANFAAQAKSNGQLATVTQGKLDASEAKVIKLQEENAVLHSKVAERDAQIVSARRVADEVSAAAVSGAASTLQQLHNRLGASLKLLSQNVTTALYPFFPEEQCSQLLAGCSVSQTLKSFGTLVVQLGAVDVGQLTSSDSVRQLFGQLEEAVTRDVDVITDRWNGTSRLLHDSLSRIEIEVLESEERNSIVSQRAAMMVQAAMYLAATTSSATTPPNSASYSNFFDTQQQQRGASPHQPQHSMFANRRNAAPPTTHHYSPQQNSPQREYQQQHAQQQQQAPQTPRPNQHQQQQMQTTPRSAASAALLMSPRQGGQQHFQQQQQQQRQQQQQGGGPAASSAGTAAGAVSFKHFNSYTHTVLMSFTSAALTQKRELAKHFSDLLNEVVGTVTRMKRDSTYVMDILPIRRERDAALAELAAANRAAFELLDSRKELDRKFAEATDLIEKERLDKLREMDKVRNLEMELLAQKERVLRMEGESTDLRFALHQKHKDDAKQESVVVAHLSEQQRGLMQRSQDLERNKMNLELALAERVNEIRELSKRARVAEHEREEFADVVRKRDVEIEMKVQEIAKLHAECDETAAMVEHLKMHLQQEQLKLDHMTRQCEDWRATAQDLQRRIEVDENLMKNIMGGSSPAWLSQSQSQSQQASGFFGSAAAGAAASPTSVFHPNNSSATSRDLLNNFSGASPAADGGGGGHGEDSFLVMEAQAARNAQRALVDTALERSKLEARIEAARKEGVNSVAELRRAWDVKNKELNVRELQLQEQKERLDAFCDAVLERMAFATNSERSQRLRSDTLDHINEELRKMCGMFLRRCKRQSSILRHWEVREMARFDPVEFPRNDVGTQTERRETFTDLLRKHGGSGSRDLQQQQQQQHGRAAQGGRDLLPLLIDAALQLHETQIIGLPASSIVLAVLMSVFALISGFVYGIRKCPVC